MPLYRKPPWHILADQHGRPAVARDAYDIAGNLSLSNIVTNRMIQQFAACLTATVTRVSWGHVVLGGHA